MTTEERNVIIRTQNNALMLTAGLSLAKNSGAGLHAFALDYISGEWYEMDTTAGIEYPVMWEYSTFVARDGVVLKQPRFEAPMPDAEYKALLGIIDPAPVQTDDIVTRLETRATESAQDDEDPMPYADVLLMFNAADEIRRLQAELAQARAEVEALREAITPRVEIARVTDPKTGNVREYRWTIFVAKFMPHWSGYTTNEAQAREDAKEVIDSGKLPTLTKPA